MAERIANSRSGFSTVSLRLHASCALAAALLLCASAAMAQQNGPPSTGASSAILFVPASLEPGAGFNPATGALNGQGYSGDGLLANSSTSKLYEPVGMAYDTDGNLFIADEGNYVVRRIDHATGILSTFAGTPSTFGSTPFAGPQQATSAKIGAVAGLVVDSSNNVYVSDRNNNAVWKITPEGTISTFAGGAAVLCSGNTDSLGDGCPATQATLSNPWALGIDANNNIYIADSYNDVIRKVSSATGIISVFAGVVADAGNYGNCNASPYSVTGSGPFLATQAHLCFPEGIAFDTLGNAYISNATGDTVQMVNSNGYISTVAGTRGTRSFSGDGGPASAALLNEPAGLYVDPANRLYISDFFNGEIRMVDSSGDINDVMGTSHGGLNNNSIGEPDTEAIYNSSTGQYSGAANGIYNFLMDPYGNILAADEASGAITSAGATGQYYFGKTNQIYQTATTTSLNAGSAFYPPYITISNPSNVTLNFTGTPTVTTLTPAATPAAFAIAGGTCNFSGSLAPGASCTVVASFTPTQGGTGEGTPYTGTIVIDSNSNSSPNTILLSGNGIGTCSNGATLTFALTFTSPPNVPSLAQSAALTNTGNCPFATSGLSPAIVNQSPATPTAFSVASNDCPATLAQNAACQIGVNFTPAALSGYSADLQLTIPSYGNIHTLLNGTGITAPAVSFNPTTLTFPPTSAGTAATAMSTILTNIGNAPLNNIVVSLTGAGASYFAFKGTNNCPSTLAAGGFCTISVNFTPQAGTTDYSAAISVADNAAGTPQTVPLTGSLSSAPLTGTISLSETVHFTDAPVLAASTLLNDAETVHFTDTVPTPNASTLISIAESLHFTDSAPADSLKASTLLSIGEDLHFTDSSPANSITASTLLPISEVLHFSDAATEKSDTTISWPSPAAITYGTPLSAAQLDAAASTTGSYVYTPPSGTVLTAGSHQLSVSFTPNNLNVFTKAAGSTSLKVNTAPLTITAHDATRQYGAINPAFSGTISSTVNGDVLTEAFQTTAGLLSTPGTYPIVPSVSGTNADSYNINAVNGMLTINKTSTTVALGASSSTSLSGNPVTLTASVQPSASGTPLGSVTFFTGAVSLGSAPLSGGSASLITTQLPSGVDSLTAVYSGDADFAGNTSNIFTETVGDFDLKISLGSLTLLPGGTGTLTFTVTPEGGAFGLPIVFTATGLPPGATATFDPTSVTPGSGPVTVTVTIDAPALKAQNERSWPIGPGTRIALGALLPLIGLWRIRRAKRGALGLMALAVLSLGAAICISSCTSGGFFTEPPQSYTVTVTATSSAAVHSTSFQLTVE